MTIRAGGSAGGFRSGCCIAGAGGVVCFGTRLAVAADLEHCAVTALCSFEDILAHDVAIPDVIMHVSFRNFSRIRETGHERLVEASPTAQVSDLDQRIVYEGRHPDSFVIRT
jgi:hypothetical protein